MSSNEWIIPSRNNYVLMRRSPISLAQTIAPQFLPVVRSTSRSFFRLNCLARGSRALPQLVVTQGGRNYPWYLTVTTPARDQCGENHLHHFGSRMFDHAHQSRVQVYAKSNSLQTLQEHGTFPYRSFINEAYRDRCSSHPPHFAFTGRFELNSEFTIGNLTLCWQRVIRTCYLFLSSDSFASYMPTLSTLDLNISTLEVSPLVLHQFSVVSFRLLSLDLWSWL